MHGDIRSQRKAPGMTKALPFVLAVILALGWYSPLGAPTAATTDQQEEICASAAVFFCDNFQARALGNGDLARPTFKNQGWALSGFGSDMVIENGAGPDGTTVKLWKFNYPTPTGANGGNGGTGFMTADFPGGGRTNTYVRWYSKWSSNYVWSSISTKHNEFYTSQTGTGMQIWSSNFDGPPARGFTQPHIQTQGQPSWNFNWDPNVGSKTITAGDGWHCFEAHVQVLGGAWILEAWIDNVLQIQYVGASIWPAGGTVPVGFLNSGYWNCNSNTFNCMEDPGDRHPPMQRWQTNFVASTQRIGCVTGSSVTPSSPSPPVLQ